jgi:DNA-directed RNA polymerases I, II, and III subunit RPABC3
MAGAGGDATLFEDSFVIEKYDQSKYDRVARIYASSDDTQTAMALDINIELFPCAVGDRLQVVLATSLSLDGSKEEDKGWKDLTKGGEATLADMFDYVCHGKIYKFEDGGEEQQTMYVEALTWQEQAIPHLLQGFPVSNLLTLLLARRTSHLAAC